MNVSSSSMGLKKAAIRSRQSNEKLVTRVRKGNGQREIIGRRQKDTSVETGHQVRNE
jgi:hypothetical protein